MAIYAVLLITGSGIDDRFMCHQSTTIIWNIDDIAMAFLALFVFKRSIRCLAIFIVIVLILYKVNDNILDAVNGHCKKEIKGIFRSRKVTIHTVRYKTLSVIYMCGSFPGIVGKLNFMTGSTEPWS